nr:hypothetical protein [uncultured Albidiferax sp.]
MLNISERLQRNFPNQPFNDLAAGFDSFSGFENTHLVTNSGCNKTMASVSMHLAIIAEHIKIAPIRGVNGFAVFGSTEKKPMSRGCHIYAF